MGLRVWYGIWASLILAIAAVLSVVFRWPAVGVVWKGINGGDMAWRRNTAALWAYTWATLAWAGVFTARCIVQKGLYGADNTNALAVARILMGWPLTGVVTIFTVFMVRRASQAMTSGHSDLPEGPKKKEEDQSHD